MSKAILTVSKYNVNIKWEPLLNITYGTKLNYNQLNAKALGPCGEINGVYNYFDQNRKKINVNDILQLTLFLFGLIKINVITSHNLKYIS